LKLPKDFKIIGTDLYPYQLESFIYGATRNTAGLLLEMGLGKTLVAISIARYRIQFNNVKKVLVVCPTSIINNWENEIKKFSEYSSLIVRAEREERSHRLSSKNHIFYIINYESIFPTLKDLEIFRGGKLVKSYKKLVKRLGIGMTIFDESARYLKNPVAKRTLASAVLADEAKYKLILTGTPIANKPMDLWSQFRVLDGGKTFGPNFFQFRNYYFYTMPNDPWKRYIIKDRAIDQIKKRLYSTCIRRRKIEVLKDLPDQIEQVLKLDMNPGLEDIYTTVKKEVLAEILTKEGFTTVNVNNILLKLLRLQQITSGFTKNRRNRVIEIPVQPKLEALIEQLNLIVDAEESAVVWCRFIKSIDMISKKLKKDGISHVTLSGEDKDKYAKWKGFQKDKSISVFIGQVESGGIGIELFKHDSEEDKSQHMIFYENTFSLDTREQAKGRTHRIGQKSTCMYMDLIVKDTIDEQILKSLTEKKNVADLIVERGIESFFEKEGKDENKTVQ
jgi:SNF2 family DNA or RNA helicase